MDPVTAAALISVTPAIAQAITGIVQTQKAKKFDDVERPSLDTPESLLEALGLAEKQASTSKLPGQDIIEAQLGAGTARQSQNIIDISQSPSDALNAISGLQSQEQAGIRKLNLAGVQRQDENQTQLLQMMQIMAQFESKQFDVNQMKPFLDAAAAASSLKGAGMQNIFAGGSDIAGVGAGSLNPPTALPAASLTDAPPTNLSESLFR